MTDIEICERIIKEGSCENFRCGYDCPLYDGVFDCDNFPSIYQEKNTVVAAKLYLDHHKKEKTMNRDQAVIAMVNGYKIQHEKLHGKKNYFNFYNNGHFYGIVNGVTTVLDVRLLRKCGWLIYKEKTKVWQFSYKAQGNANNIVGEVSKHMTEEQAKEKYGDDCVKLEWTVKEVEL